MATRNLYRITSLINMIGIILCAVSLFLAFKKIDFNLSTIKPGKGTNNDDLSWFSGISIIFCGFLAVSIAIYEIMLLINPIKFKFYNYAILRVIVYLYLGIAIIGVSGDLGISASAFTLLNALLNFFVFMGAFCECFKIEDDLPIVYQPADITIPKPADLGNKTVL